jgi:hypothetical protein
LNPDWIKHFIKGVFVQLIMLRPNHWWPMVIGNAHYEDDKAPEELLVSKVKIKFPQHDRDQCFIGGVASSLYYCGLIEEANRIKNLAHKFEFIPKPAALQELKRVMRELAPCIGDCMAFNLRTKNKKIKHLTIQDLIEISRQGFRPWLFLMKKTVQIIILLWLLTVSSLTPPKHIT